MTPVAMDLILNWRERHERRARRCMLSMGFVIVAQTLVILWLAVGR
jgi:hypothetical protein